MRDDGVGGARADGTGLVGLSDRLTALDGSLRVESPPGGGTLCRGFHPRPLIRLRQGRSAASVWASRS